MLSARQAVNTIKITYHYFSSSINIHEAINARIEGINPWKLLEKHTNQVTETIQLFNKCYLWWGQRKREHNSLLLTHLKTKRQNDLQNLCCSWKNQSKIRYYDQEFSLSYEARLMNRTRDSSIGHEIQIIRVEQPMFHIASIQRMH